MSAFLGPIHYWLYKKIQKLEEIEMSLLNVNVPVTYMYLTKDLEEVVDETQIHTSLQEMIKLTEFRFAQVMKVLIEQKNSDIEWIKSIFKNHGAHDGKSVKLIKESNSIELIYKHLNDYILDGMPCDNINNIISNEKNELSWFTKNSLHSPYWEGVGLDVDIYYNFRKHYIQSFIDVFDPNLQYSFIHDGDTLTHQISRS
ncbi:MAG: hypothetical protein JW702_01360 [Clostridiales bacterium]|nr:hypothetical protein [Clostridiales bacterium]